MVQIMSNAPYRVLFVCVHNAGRSQMAEASFNHFARCAGIDALAESAGTLGAGTLNPVAVQVMEELGISMKNQVPKQLTPEMVAQADRVVSMGCGVDAESCPTRFIVTEDWGLADPAGQAEDAVRLIRDEVIVRVKALLSELGAPV